EFARPEAGTERPPAQRASGGRKSAGAETLSRHRRTDIRRSPGPPAGESPAVTHGDKVLFPELGITKAQVLEFYRRIAPYLLPHLRDRPATLERLPEGLAGPDAPHFWQKNAPTYYPSWIPIAELNTERGKPVRYVLVNNLETLLYLVNQGTLTFHVWFSRVEDLDRPDSVL